MCLSDTAPRSQKEREMEKVDRIAHFLGHIAGGDDCLDDVDAICTRITELERERDEARAEVERLRRALIDARLMSGRKMPTSPDADLIAQNSIDDAPPDPLIRVDEIEEAYHSADDSKLVFKEVKP
jgi:septation ring formation regulator EzrA